MFLSIPSITNWLFVETVLSLLVGRVLAAEKISYSQAWISANGAADGLGYISSYAETIPASLAIFTQRCASSCDSVGACVFFNVYQELTSRPTADICVLWSQVKPKSSATNTYNHGKPISNSVGYILYRKNAQQSKPFTNASSTTILGYATPSAGGPASGYTLSWSDSNTIAGGSGYISAYISKTTNYAALISDCANSCSGSSSCVFFNAYQEFQSYRLVNICVLWAQIKPRPPTSGSSNAGKTISNSSGHIICDPKRLSGMTTTVVPKTINTVARVTSIRTISSVPVEMTTSITKIVSSSPITSIHPTAYSSAVATSTSTENTLKTSLLTTKSITSSYMDSAMMTGATAFKSLPSSATLVDTFSSEIRTSTSKMWITSSSTNATHNATSASISSDFSTASPIVSSMNQPTFLSTIPSSMIIGPTTFSELASATTSSTASVSSISSKFPISTQTPTTVYTTSEATIESTTSAELASTTTNPAMSISATSSNYPTSTPTSTIVYANSIATIINSDTLSADQVNSQISSTGIMQTDAQSSQGTNSTTSGFQSASSSSSSETTMLTIGSISALTSSSTTSATILTLASVSSTAIAVPTVCANGLRIPDMTQTYYVYSVSNRTGRTGFVQKLLTTRESYYSTVTSDLTQALIVRPVLLLTDSCRFSLQTVSSNVYPQYPYFGVASPGSIGQIQSAAQGLFVQSSYNTGPATNYRMSSLPSYQYVGSESSVYSTQDGLNLNYTWIQNTGAELICTATFNLNSMNLSPADNSVGITASGAALTLVPVM